MPVNVTVSSDIDDDNGRVTRTRHASARERRCIVSGVVLPEARLVRFALDGEGRVTPDIAAKLPGRGMWVSADRESVSRAVAKNMFSRAAQTHAKADANLADRVETLLAAQLQGWLGLARRAGQLLLGFDVIERTIRDGKAPLVIVEASDAGAEGQRKLQEAAEARGIAPFVVTGLTRDELGLALGRGNVVHAALISGQKSGSLAERLISDAGRLAGFRPFRPWAWKGFSPQPAANV